MSKNTKEQLRICPYGHKYYKTSECPVCPLCESKAKPEEGFLSLIVAPARRALQNEGILSLSELSRYTEPELLKLHGMGKTSIPKLKEVLSSNGLKLKDH